MLRALGRETVTIVSAVLIVSARDNSQNRDWANATQVDAVGCSVQPFLMSNKLIQVDNKDREFVQEFLRVYIPAGQPVPLYTDRLVWRGRSAEAFGPSQPWYHNGVLHHTQIVARVRIG